MTKYELLSGETIDLLPLPKEAQEHISKIEELINNSEDYNEVSRQVFVSLREGKNLTPEIIRNLENSPRYKIVVDLLARYHQKLFGEES